MIIRCICAGKTFAELLEHARLHGSSMTDLGREFGCGRACGLCRPYLQAALSTGRTEFDPAKPIPWEDRLYHEADERGEV